MEPYDIREQIKKFERSVIIDNIKALLLLILGVLLLLSVCISVDYADEPITAEAEPMNTSNCTVVDGVHYDNKIINNTGIAKVHKVVHIKPHYPVVTITAKPSCSCKNPYRWHKRTFIDYCPHCHHYNALYNKHKYQARYEQELTCKFCDSDFCGVCGKTKYSWSRVYLRKP